VSASDRRYPTDRVRQRRRLVIAGSTSTQGLTLFVKDLRTGRVSLEYRNFVLNAYDLAATFLELVVPARNRLHTQDREPFWGLQPDLGGGNVSLRWDGHRELLVAARRNLFWGDGYVGAGHAGRGERQEHAQKHDPVQSGSHPTNLLILCLRNNPPYPLFAK
jgi:hypothetical protein